MMLRKCFLVVALLGGIAGVRAGTEALAPAREAVILARENSALVSITISPDASEALAKTAADLAAVLKRMTGAEFAIERSAKPKGLTLGTLAQFPDDTLKGALAVRENYDGLEAFVIRTDQGGVRLIANTDLGASHAAYRFLESLGCRWFFPGQAWEVIPHSSSLSFAGNENSRPDIWSRDIWFGRTAQPWEPGDPNGTQIFNAWKKANRLGESLKVNVSHRWHALPKEYKEEFAAHPEYLALVDGKRIEPQLCVTNPGLQQLVVKSVEQYFAKNPQADMATLDPADWPDWCTCPECQKLGHHSNQAFYLANLVAKEIRQKLPGKYVGLLAYTWHSDAPPFVLEPNVYVQLTAGMNASKFRFDELFKMWGEKCSHLGIYEYYSYWQMDRAMLPGTGVSNKLDDLSARMKGFVAGKVNSISAQSANCWGVNGLGYYLASRLMWDVSSDVAALKKNFYTDAFGPAAAVMERYYERLNLNNEPLAGLGLLRECLGDLDEAATLAAARPDVMTRLRALQENLIYNHLGRKVDAAKDLAEEKKRTLEWFTWAYRTRNNYMNDWITFRSAVGRPTSEKFKEPDWFWRNTVKKPEANPWRVNRQVTDDEISQALQEIRQVALLPSPTADDSDLVLVKTGSSAGAEVHQTFNGRATFLLAGGKDGKLNLTITRRERIIRLGEGVAGFEATRDIVMEAPDGRYRVLGPDGAEVASGRLAAGRHDLSFPAQAAGVYRFICDDPRGDWEVAIPPEVRSGLLYERAESCRPEKELPGYFYVPKGTKTVNFYVAPGGTITIRDARGTVVSEGSSAGEYHSAPVGPGQDGAVWSLQGKYEGLWFFDLPTALSFDQGAVFVTEKTAGRDGMERVRKK